MSDPIADERDGDGRVLPLRRRTAVHPPPDDLSGIDTDGLVAALGDALPGPSRLLIGTIVVLGLAQLVAVLPWLVDADPFGLLGDTSGAHLTRDGALGLAVAAAALLTGYRPRWALPCFVLGSIALVAQTLAGVVDQSIASTGGTELIHLPSVVLTCLTGLASIRLRPLGPRHPRIR